MDPTKVKRLLTKLFGEILPALTDALTAISVDDAVVAEPTEPEQAPEPEPAIQSLTTLTEDLAAYKRRRAKLTGKELDLRLSTRQQAFCRLVAEGKTKAEAYAASYTMRSPLASAADSAAVALMRQQKIRDRIAKFRTDLGTTTTAPATDRFDEIRSDGGSGGWAFRLTPKQERFCRSRALGRTAIFAFKAAGYKLENYSTNGMEAKADAMLELPKIQQRIAALIAGDAPEISTSDVGRRPRKKKVAAVVAELVGVEEAVSEPEEEVTPPPPIPASRRPSTTIIGTTTEIPARLLAALSRYSQNHIQPGGFLTALLSNNLHIALRLASPTSLSSLPEILRYVQKHLPALAYGSPEKVMAWLDSGEKREWRALPEGADLIRTANAGAVQDYLDAAHDVGEAAGEAD